MQLTVIFVLPPKLSVSAGKSLAAMVVAGLAFALFGCGAGDSAGPATQVSNPYAGATVTIACPDVSLAEDVKNRTASWASEHKVAVKIETRPVAEVPAADAAIVPASDLGGLAADGKLAVLPARVRQGDHELKWIQIAEPFRKSLSGWGGDVVGIPIVGDGLVLVYRADRFADPTHRQNFRRLPNHAGRELAPPATWEEYLEIAAFFASAEKKPSLPPLPSNPSRLVTDFCQIAACYDRKSQTPTEIAGAGRTGVEESSFAFQLDLATGDPLLTRPAFLEAASWFEKSRQYRTPGSSDHPVDALSTGTAVLGLASLDDLARLRGGAREMPKKFGIAPLPGSRFYFDANAQRVPVPTRNFVPYLGSGTRIGVVLKSSRNADAAWDLLADAGSLAGSLTILSQDSRGYGPFRSEHLDEGREQSWIEHGLDADRVRDLSRALRQQAGVASGNPVYVLRTPDQAELMAALEKQVRAVANGETKPDAAMQKAAEEWKTIEAKTPPEKLRTWRRSAAGLQ